jgi:hypothetical protein
MGPPARVAVAEANLHPFYGPGDPAGEIKRVEQGDSEPGPLGGLDKRPAHGVLVGVRPPGRCVVEVVKLADAGDPGQGHLCVHGGGEVEVCIRLEPRRHLVHPLPPRPERPSLGLRVPTQGTVERVRVNVRKPGQDETG